MAEIKVDLTKEKTFKTGDAFYTWLSIRPSWPRIPMVIASPSLDLLCRKNAIRKQLRDCCAVKTQPLQPQRITIDGLRSYALALDILRLRHFHRPGPNTRERSSREFASAHPRTKAKNAFVRGGYGGRAVRDAASKVLAGPISAEDNSTGDLVVFPVHAQLFRDVDEMLAHAASKSLCPQRRAAKVILPLTLPKFRQLVSATRRHECSRVINFIGGDYGEK